MKLKKVLMILLVFLTLNNINTRECGLRELFGNQIELSE